MVWRVLRFLPFGLGPLALAVFTLLLWGNLGLAVLGMGVMKLSPSLNGVTEPIRLEWSWEGLLRGENQAVFGRLIGTKMPLYPDAVRLRNQVAYSLFGVSADPTIVVGRGNRLVDLPYLQDYCSRDIAAWRPGAVGWAANIRQMQDAVERRGKTFLYVLTPSKLAQYPGILPPGYGCPSSEADRVGLVPEWMALIRQAGIHAVDTTAVITAAHGAYPFALYPPGGTHWNHVGEALAVQAVMAGLDAQLPGKGFGPYQFTWHMTPRAEGVDRDLGDLMNLFTHPWTVPVPAVTLAPAPGGGTCPARQLVIVGGSFGHAIGDVLTALPCHPEVTEYEYWRRSTVTWPQGEAFKAPVDESARDRAILNADIVVYEENEQILAQPDVGRALLHFLMEVRG
jgi:hypothetical protein